MRVFIQVQLVMITSAPSDKKREAGRRLTRNANFTAVFTDVSAQVLGFGAGERVVRRGRIRREKMTKRLVDIANVVRYIAFTWSCTKSFWFLRPADTLLSFKSPRGRRISTEVTAGSSPRC